MRCARTQTTSARRDSARAAQRDSTYLAVTAHNAHAVDHATGESLVAKTAGSVRTARTRNAVDLGQLAQLPAAHTLEELHGVALLAAPHRLEVLESACKGALHRKAAFARVSKCATARAFACLSGRLGAGDRHSPCRRGCKHNAAHQLRHLHARTHALHRARLDMPSTPLGPQACVLCARGPPRRMAILSPSVRA